MTAELTQPELLRYSRHILIPNVGVAGQLRLKSASVLLIGVGALGSPAAIYLAAAGVGRIGLVDDDTVEASNLQRQILHGESWIGKSKLESAASRLREVNPNVEVELHAVRFLPSNSMKIAGTYDVLVDGSDNFPTRFLTNDTAFFLRKPLVHGAIHRFEGQSAVFSPHLSGPCYRCLLPQLPAAGSVPSCQEAGVMGVLPGIVGSLQAMETIKLILGIGEIPLGRLTCYDALRSEFRSIKLSKDPQCRLCGNPPEIFSVQNPETVPLVTCTTQSNKMDSITTTDLRLLLHNGFSGTLLDVRDPHEHAASSIPGAILSPLGDLENRLDEVPSDREILVHCKSGARSAKAVKILLDHGFPQVRNVTGGIDSWLAES